MTVPIDHSASMDRSTLLERLGGSARRRPILRFVVRRITAGLATLLVATVLIFLAVQALPSDVATAVLGKNATPEAVARIHTELGLDRPLPQRYVEWLGGMVTGRFGNSTVSAAQGFEATPVWELIETPLRNSLLLALTTLVILVPLAILLGAAAALRAGRAADHAISVPALALGAMPEFLIGTLLVVVFFTWLDLLPPLSQVLPGETPFSHPDRLVLPVATLLGTSLSYTVRLVRAATIDVLSQDFVAMARLNGFREHRVIWRYVLRNALAPSVQAIAITAQYLVGGIVVVESVFNYPGIGNALVQAVGSRDVQVIMVITAIIAALTVALNVLADFVVMVLVPRIRTVSA